MAAAGGAFGPERAAPGLKRQMGKNFAGRNCILDSPKQ